MNVFARLANVSSVPAPAPSSQTAVVPVGTRNQWSQYRLLKSLTASGGCECEGNCSSGWVEEENCILSICGKAD